MPDLYKYGLPIFFMFIIYSIGHVLYAKTLIKVEASIFTILLSTSSVWIMILSFYFFKERLALGQIIGAILIFLSIIFIYKSKSLLKLNTGILMGLATGFLFGIGSTLWVYIGKNNDSISWLILSFAGPSILILLTNPKSLPKIREFSSSAKIIKMIFLSLFFVITNLSLLKAYQLGKVIIIAPLQQTTLIFTVLFAIIFLKEYKGLRQKIISVIICFIGVIFLTLLSH